MSLVISSTLIFGGNLYEYRSYPTSVASIFNLLLGKFSYHQFAQTNMVLGPVFFFGFNIMVNWILMNMFISILDDAFSEVKENTRLQSNDYEMIDFIMEQFKGKGLTFVTIYVDIILYFLYFSYFWLCLSITKLYIDTCILVVMQITISPLTYLGMSFFLLSRLLVWLLIVNEYSVL